MAQLLHTTTNGYLLKQNHHNEWKRKNYGYGFWENDELKGYLFGNASQPFAWSGQREATVYHWYSSTNSNIGMKLLKHFEQYLSKIL